MELMVVVAIIAFLSMVAIAAVKNAKTKANNADRIQTVEQYYKVMALYYAEKKQYPDSLYSAGTCLGAYASTTSKRCWLNNIVASGPFEWSIKDYIPELPKDSVVCGGIKRDNYKYSVLTTLVIDPKTRKKIMVRDLQHFTIWFILDSHDPKLCEVLNIGKLESIIKIGTVNTNCEICKISSD